MKQIENFDDYRTMVDEVSDRQRISQETERRAALLLTPEEFRALYGHSPKPDSKAA